MSAIENLRRARSEVADKVARFSGKAITEQDTKNALIEPILAALGWAKTDLDLVRAEYRHTSKDNPVDYALFAKSQPVLFVEAKALDLPIAEHRNVSQVISYANVSGVRWALLTNGREWALYKVFADVQGEQKRLFSVDIADPAAVDWLRWIVPDRLSGNELDDLWRRCFAERRVRDLLKGMIAARDSDLVAFLAKRTSLGAQDVTAGLHLLRVTFEEPEAGPPAVSDTLQTSPPAPTPALRVVEPEDQPKARVLAAPAAGSKPVRFRIGDRAWPVRLWRDLPVITCSFLSETRPKEFASVFEAAEFQGRKRRLVATTTGGFRQPAVVPGGFIEVNLSAASCVDLAERLLVFCGVDPRTAGYESQSDLASAS